MARSAREPIDGLFIMPKCLDDILYGFAIGNTRLTFRYADLVETQRLSECTSMVKHIRKGLAMVVPVAVSKRHPSTWCVPTP